ncbi:hypothetical protein [Paraburkholderia solisilvae]|uniref:Lipid A biosynthesis lauroyltransferase n=1 Tax=Paraburkholderia solisilvae TaxID=624376 RepID=A0A6J5DAE7_9BURK|nr:hypothetical protein [Paraburkholderia solisilvae]CAB3750404.1 hypothetical protein LMG29739_01082 [Paraburkholderia solisilvae]
MKFLLSPWRLLLRAVRLGAVWHYRLRARLLCRMSLRTIEHLALAGWAIRSIVDARARWAGLERWETGRDVLRLQALKRRDVLIGARLERLIDQRLHFGRQLCRAETWPDLQAVAAAIANTMAVLKAQAPGRPVIVAPLHYVSQYANIYVVDELRKQLGLESIGVVSGVPRNLYGDDDALIPAIDVLHTYSGENRHGLGLRVARSLRRNGVVVLFADVPPYTLMRFPMETVNVTMFGRAARIHHGVFRLGAPADAWLLPFYLRFERGRFGAQLCDAIPLAAADAPQRVADCIESALTDNFARSLVTGHSAIYSFSPSR